MNFAFLLIFGAFRRLLLLHFWRTTKRTIFGGARRPRALLFFFFFNMNVTTHNPFLLLASTLFLSFLFGWLVLSRRVNIRAGCFLSAKVRREREAVLVSLGRTCSFGFSFGSVREMGGFVYMAGLVLWGRLSAVRAGDVVCDDWLQLGKYCWSTLPKALLFRFCFLSPVKVHLG